MCLKCLLDVIIFYSILVSPFYNSFKGVLSAPPVCLVQSKSSVLNCFCKGAYISWVNYFEKFIALGNFHFNIFILHSLSANSSLVLLHRPQMFNQL